MRQFKKDAADIITVNTKKALELDNYNRNIPDNLYKYYIKNTAGNYWTNTDLISLSYGQFAKQLCTDKKELIETQTCKTISHEIVHRVILGQTNIKVCIAFDNIAESLESYGVW